LFVSTDNFRKPFEFAEDRISVAVPIGMDCSGRYGVDERVNALGQFLDGAKGAAADGLLGDQAKPAFDLIEPGRIGLG